MFNWNDLESFLMLSRHRKLNFTSKTLKIEPTTISRRIFRLEKKLGTKLFYRSNNLYVLSDDGQRLLLHAEKIESEIFAINEIFFNKNINLIGKVRISIPEGLGIQIFTKYLKNFYDKYKDLEIELLADTKSRSLSNREIDISVTLSRPTTGKLISKKLADYKLQLFGSDDYLEKHSCINNINDLSKHNFISYVDDLIDFPELKYLQESYKSAKIVFRSNSLQAQLNAVKQGVGIALLHNFIAKNENNLKIILKDEIQISREYWIVVHEDLIKLKRIRVVLDFINEVMIEEKSNLKL